MINQQLLTYISSQQEAGIDDEMIKDNLLSAGWRQEDVDEGFGAIETNLDADNSSAAHQQVREEAVQKSRGNQSIDTTDESESDDFYREPIESEDTDNAADLQDQTELKDDDSEKIGDLPDSADEDEEDQLDTQSETTPATQEGVVAEDNQSTVSMDEQEDDDTSSTQESDEPRELKNIGGSTNPLDSHEEMKKLAAEGEGEENDPGPLAIRTFHRDSQQAGGNGQKSEKVDEPKGAKARHVKKTDGVRVKRSPAQKQKINDDGLNKAVESVASAQGARKNLGNELIDNPRNQMEPVNDKPAAKPKRMPSDDQSGPESTSDGKRRFSAGKTTAKASKPTRGKKKSGSGSKFVSILIFILVLALIGGGAAYAYMTYFQDSSPEVTAEQMMNSLAEAETFDFRIMIESANELDTTTDRLTIEGVMDLNTDTETQSYYVVTHSEPSFSPIQAVMPEVENIVSVPAIQRETIRDILLTPEFFTLGEFQTEEQLGQSDSNDGFTTNRFGITAEPGQLVSEYAILYQALFDSAVSQDVISNLQATVGAFQPVQGQAWLDSETNVPYQITLIGTGADGQDMQINLQIKNHGYIPETTPSYEARSTEQILAAIFSPEDTTSQLDDIDDDESDEIDPSDDDTSDATSTDSDSSNNDDATSTDSDTSDDDEPDDTGPQMSVDNMRRFDQLRINDVQQIKAALRMYASENGSFPGNLSQLTSGQNTVLSSIPRDPMTAVAYSYGVSQSADRYHLGATLQTYLRMDTPNDANFNSAAQNFTNGFNGAGTACGSTSLNTISTCYDITASVQ
ncbi:MAG: hypothetical protein WD335_03685 [Candidatus Paceibacterota bacterium]